MAMPLAGKYAQALGHPLTLGLAAGGASLLGNQILPDEVNKGQGRAALEALGSGLGAAGLQAVLRPAVRSNPLTHAVTGGAAAPLALAIGSPLGRLIGGGVANVAGALGVRGMSQGTPNPALNTQNNIAMAQAAIDPEAYGSSNSGY